MKVVFFGTPQFSAEILKDLIEKGLDIVAVVTQPDKLQGRHLKLHKPAVKKMIEEIDPNIKVLQPKKISDPSFYDIIETFQADLFVVVAFGQIFPETLLKMPRLGCVNVHTSLLPKYRGAAPIERVLINGESVTGVTIMYMVKELDAGDILATKKVEIAPQMNALDLTLALCEASKNLLYPTLQRLNEGKIKPLAQEHDQATYAKKVLPKDGQINWKCPAVEILNQFRGVSPKPGAWCIMELRGKEVRVKILKLSLSLLEGRPSEILKYSQEHIIVGCESQSIKIERLQVEGKKPLEVSEFIKGYSLKDIFFKNETCTSVS